MGELLTALLTRPVDVAELRIDVRRPASDVFAAQRPRTETPGDEPSPPLTSASRPFTDEISHAH